MAKKLKVTVANNNIWHVRRTWLDFWLFDGFKTTSFHVGDRRVRIANHWILIIEDDELNALEGVETPITVPYESKEDKEGE
jgi:hypothetical protein